MEKIVVSTSDAPAAIGPYSQAIKANGTFIFTAGQIALHPKTGEIVGNTIQEQTHQVIKNISAILSAAGADLKHVVKTSVYLQDIDDFALMNEVYASYFNGDPPARCAFGANDLPKSAKLMIECVAVV